jgi:hypothetical protein
MKFEQVKLSHSIIGGVLVLACAALAAPAFAQGAASSAAGANNSGATTGSTVSGASGSSITHPEAGANNDPALTEPKPGPTGAPGVGTEFGSPDANGVHSNMAMPLPSPAK